MLLRMKRLGLLSIAFALSCNSASDGDTDTEGNSGGGSGDTDNATTETATITASDSANTETASGSAATGEGSSSTSDASSSEGSSSEGSSSSASGIDSSSGESGSTGGIGPQQLCESTDGTWEPNACGDYVCGLPNDCEAVIPGCNCGQDANFVEGEGCVAADICTTFDCGEELQCVTALQYCTITSPPVKGAALVYECLSMPEACTDEVDCTCLQAELMLPLLSFCNEPTPDGLIVELFEA